MPHLPFFELSERIDTGEFASFFRCPSSLHCRRRDPLGVRAQVRDHLPPAFELDRIGLEFDHRRRQLADEDRQARRGRLSRRVAQDGFVIWCPFARPSITHAPPRV